MHSRTHDHILQLLSRYQRVKKPVMIDYGCGNGALLEIINPVKLKSYHGYDVNQHSLQALTTRFPHRHIFSHLVNKKQLLRLGKTNSIDVVVSVGVLQYLSDHELKILFKEIRRVLKQKGILVFSCAHDHWLYKVINFTGLFLPNRYFTKSELSQLLEKNHLTLKYLRARGPLLNPLFSYFGVFGFDALDKLLFSTKGVIGPIGSWARRICQPLLAAELDLNLDIGYTLFVVATK